MRQTQRWAFLGCLSASTLAAGWTMDACGGTSNTVDGGPDATSSDSPSDTNPMNDVVSNDVNDNDTGASCPTYNGAVELCNAGISRCTACGSTLTACQTANYTTECEALANFFSQAYANATAACASTCDTDADTACIKANLADAALTTAQTQPAMAYCNECFSGNVAACVTAFEGNINLINYSDSVCTSIAQKCTPDASTDAACAPLKYGTCAELTILGSIPTTPCADASAD
jgi:hypothetical protein